MAKQLLDCVNQILTRTSVIQGNAGLLTSLTDSARQRFIDVAVQVVNEGIDELYSQSRMTMPNEGAESTIVLVTGQREYALATDLSVMKMDAPMIDRVHNQYIYPWRDSYESFLLFDPQQTMTGTPQYWIISPITSKLRTEISPSAGVNGNTYYYEYERNIELTAATDVVPFTNPVFRAMVPAWVQLYKREIRNEFDVELYRQAMGRASRLVSQIDTRTSYSPIVIADRVAGFDPYEK